MKKIVSILCVMFVFVSPAWATIVELTKDGLGLSQNNYGTLLAIDDVVQISAVTHIGQPYGPLTGTVYLGKDNKGLGVQTLSASGSKGISGGGGDQDEALIIDFIGNVFASSISVGLNEYEQHKDDTILTLYLSDGQEIEYTEAHQNWDNAVTLIGSNKAVVDIGVLLGQNIGQQASSLSIMETTDHIYVNSVGYKIPEPTSIALLGLGCLTLLKSRKRRG